jgi:predicted membrane protein
MAYMSTSYTDGDNSTADDVVRAFATLGEQRIVSRSSAFRAGSLTAIASEVTLDLLDAQLAPEGAVVDAMSVLGEIRILVPPGWRVAVDGTPVGGTIKNKGKGAGTADGPQLRVKATAVFGEVKVKRPS